MAADEYETDRLPANEARGTASPRGHLKIFFGAVAGVGKTYAMLETARTRQAEGVDVVIGYVEPHMRPETDALLAGLESIPLRVLEYHGAQLREFDLDAAIARKPTLILVDELAHTNVAGSRHTKRWQDVEELLDAGINVYTAVNVQHLESLNDVVAQITGTVVRETIPDSILEAADEVEMIDVSPDELLIRLREGKVYLPEQAEYAIQKFFRKGNLMALRELALRRTAERVDEQMQVYRQDQAVTQIWPAGERIMVCVGPSSLSSRLVRAAKRMATGLHAEWITVYVEPPNNAKLSEAETEMVVQTLRLAEQLGAETVTLSGRNITDEILTYARKRNVTKIVVGKPNHPVWRDLLYGSVLNKLIRQSGSIDVYVINSPVDVQPPVNTETVSGKTVNWGTHLRAFLIVMLCTLVAGLLFPLFAPTNLIMIYLVGIVFVASRYGRGPSLFASVLSVLAFDFFFVPPFLTFAVSDSEYVVTFAVMILVALTISSMTARIRDQVDAARVPERRTTSLYEMSRDFANNSQAELLANIAVRHLEGIFDSEALLLLPDSNMQVKAFGSDSANKQLSVQELHVAQWVYDHGQEAGIGTQTLPGARGLYLPLLTPQGKIGVLSVQSSDPTRFATIEQKHLLETFANQTALAIERAQLTHETEHARVQIETERLRNSLLSSVSHDLRTPLAVITGAVSGLLDQGHNLDMSGRELAQVAYEEADRLNRLVGNLLEMTRLESRSVKVEKEWQPLEEVVGTTLLRLEPLMANHPLKTTLPDDLPLVPIDAVLIEQVLVNLLENAAKYTPPNSHIELSAWADGKEIVVEVADHGPGLPPGEEQRIFDKFYRVRPTITSGVGLGLAICRAVIEVHGGRIWAENRNGGGAKFRFTLPIDGEPPTIDMDSE